MTLALIVLGALLAVVLYDIRQRHHTILHNFPIIGHFRYLLETIGPELRRYIVTGNDEERPFSRDQRSWIYASAKLENNLSGFGTDNDIERASNYLIIRHAMFPHIGADGYGVAPDYRLPVGKILGGHRRRKLAFEPPSVVNVSSMSFGSLSKNAVLALNEGCKLAGALR